ncbi:MAG: beta-aspartyl-peptidase [Firmicutes bacterium]|nr:beta-aspartyl-peptidase [Bacillota bacterium]
MEFVELIEGASLIENVHVYAPEDLGVNDLVLCYDKIVEIGKDLTALYPRTRKIDGRGLLAVPGFIDQHVHITGGGGEGSFKTRVPPLRFTDCVQAGVTTLVGLLGTDGITRSVEDLLAKTKALNEEGVTAYCLTGSYQYPSITLTGDVKKDIAFINEVVGVKIALSDHRCSHPTREDLIRLASDARMASLISGKPGLVTIHMGRGKGRLDLIFQILEETDIPIKHFRPTHVGKLGEAAVRFAKMGGYIDFTASSRPSEAAGDIVQAIQAGAPLQRITLSSDANGSLPKWNEENEMIGITAASMQSLHKVVTELIIGEGMPVTDALRLVTENAAQALELDGRKGRLEAGYDADLLLLDSEFHLDTVIARGQVLMQGGELKVQDGIMLD